MDYVHNVMEPRDEVGNNNGGGGNGSNHNQLVQRIRSMIPGINPGVSYGDGSDPSIHFFDQDAYHNSFALCEVLKHFLLEGKTSDLCRFLQGPSCNAKSWHSVTILFRMSLLLRADTTKSKLSAVVPPQRIFMGIRWIWWHWCRVRS
jgi:hypothetical protein